MIGNTIDPFTAVDLTIGAVGFLMIIKFFFGHTLYFQSVAIRNILIIVTGAGIIAASFSAHSLLLWWMPTTTAVPLAWNITWLPLTLGACVMAVGIVRTWRSIKELTRDLHSTQQSLTTGNSIFKTLEERYSSLVEGSEFGVGIERMSGERLFANRRFVEMFGFTNEQEFLKANSAPGAMIAPHDRERMLKNREARRRGEGVLNSYEFDAICKDGTTLPVRVLVREIIWDGEAAILRTFFEISERKAAEDALKDSEARFKSIVDNSPTKIHIKDAQGRYVLINRIAEKLFGVTNDEVRGKTTHEIFPNTVATDFVEHDRAVLESGKVVEQEEEWPDKDGVRTFLTVKFPIRDAAGKITAVGAIGTDITVRKRVEAALQKSKEQAELANRTKSEFLANMSHELRTPLNAIIGFSDMIRKQSFGPVGSPKYLEYINDINESGTHLLKIINDILDLSKIEAGKIELHEEQVNVPDTVEGCLLLVRTRARECGVTLTSETPDDLPALYADERMLKQILINLLSNAIKFTPTGGEVKVKSWCRADTGFVFQVMDTGIGIALDDIPNALAPFKQIDGELNRQFDGTGLGLPLTKSLTELHGGSLDLQSEIGVGTTVTIRFPAERIIRNSPSKNLSPEHSAQYLRA
jgi:PAS domain S-box-containing protein